MTMKNDNKEELKIKTFEDVRESWLEFFSFYRQYPDLFIDLISPPNPKIKLYDYQRIMLRILFRYQNVYITMTRGTAKSYTQILALYLKCIMYPGIKLFLCAPTARQASKISKDNIEAIWNHFPLLKNELVESKCTYTTEYVRIIFKNGSQLEVMQVAQSSRGTRAHGGSIEEIVDEHMKKDTLNEVVIPTMANDRRVGTFGVDKNEVRKSVTVVTTCGTRQSFAYEKLVEVAGEMARGENSFILGCGYELPVMHEQLELEFINGLKKKETYSTASFDREYRSIWSGSSERGVAKIDDINTVRILEKAEHKNMDPNAMYILSYDVARMDGKKNANSALIVFKCTLKNNGTYSKRIVNVYSLEGKHFMEQAKFLKQKVNEFKPEMLVVDGNGIGKALVDLLVIEIDDNPPYEVVNDDRYDMYKTKNSIPILYSMNSTNKETKESDINNVFISAMENHEIKLLVSESQARQNLKVKRGEDEEMALLPYIMTDIMIEEWMNVEYKMQGKDTKVNQISKRIPKDKYSATAYGLYYIHLLEQKNRQRKVETFDMSGAFLVKKAKRHR